MKRIHGLAGAMLLSCSALAADDYGMVMDLEGEMHIMRAEQQLEGDLGESVNVGDRLLLDEGARVTIVSYLDCREMILSGPAEAEVAWDQLKTRDQSRLTTGRVLPVCYSQDELNTSDSGVIGGLVLRGSASDPVEDLRNEFAQGNISNSSLMTLVMHDLANGDPQRARPYYNTLRERIPDAAFITKVEGYFGAAD